MSETHRETGFVQEFMRTECKGLFDSNYGARYDLLTCKSYYSPKLQVSPLTDPIVVPNRNPYITPFKEPRLQTLNPKS